MYFGAALQFVALAALVCALVLGRRRGYVRMVRDPAPQVFDLSAPDRAAIERLTAGMRELSGQIAQRRAEPAKQPERQQPQPAKSKSRKR